MEINVQDYLSEDEMKEIAKDVWADKCRYKLEKDKERIISNEAYTCVFRMVDEVFGENLNQILTEKIVEIIKDMSSFSVFRVKNAWDRDESVAQKVMCQVVEENKHILKDTVVAQMLNAKIDDEMVAEAVREVIVDKLTS